MRIGEQESCESVMLSIAQAVRISGPVATCMHSSFLRILPDRASRGLCTDAYHRKKKFAISATATQSNMICANFARKLDSVISVAFHTKSACFCDPLCMDPDG